MCSLASGWTDTVLLLICVFAVGWSTGTKRRGPLLNSPQCLNLQAVAAQIASSPVIPWSQILNLLDL